jgi:hypothetical protein
MIRLMVRWLKTFLFVDKKDIRFRVVVQGDHSKSSILAFWTKTLAVESSLFAFTVLKASKNPTKKAVSDMGCMRMSIYGVSHIRTMNAWQKLLMQYYDEAI